ncbi:MAG: AraC family transcriptional regulator [Peptoniphilaceae bacterium]|nr:AraC family transcriptional regulator [Peptoniphilaceae bacterium]MDD7383849.1 AraC family transcriptional regulator [Peptoniphilaceae bacterium]MDY3738148.1 AraC family transcriptional regulator [Peptoniphilaceae bacterium]MDY6018119.1 AraC family transcriptional regulator [Anaerococcus sp.]
MENKFIKVQNFNDIKNRHVLTHWQDNVEIIKIDDGKMNCVVNSVKFTLKKGDICIINQKQLHRISCENENNCTFKNIFIDPSFFTANKEIYNKYIDPILNNDNISQIILNSNTSLNKEINKFIDEIEFLENNKPLAYELSIIAYIHFIFKDIYCYAKNKKVINKKSNSDILLFMRITSFIYDNFSKKITLDDLSLVGNVSRSKCSNIFKKYAGTSPIDFLNLYRLEVSTEKLINSDEQISEIALECGFGQQSYYNKLFLREYKVTPSEYRKKYSK